MKVKLRFTLAGEIVSTAQQARKILVQATLDKKDWLIPQARSVAQQLSRAGQA